MNISGSDEHERQQFDAPGEGGILGMGNNAIVHHVELEAARRIAEPGSPVMPLELLRQEESAESDASCEDRWIMLAEIDTMNLSCVAAGERRIGRLGGVGCGGQAVLLAREGLGGD